MQYDVCQLERAGHLFLVPYEGTSLKDFLFDLRKDEYFKGEGDVVVDLFFLGGRNRDDRFIKLKYFNGELDLLHLQHIASNIVLRRLTYDLVSRKYNNMYAQEDIPVEVKSFIKDSLVALV